MAASARPAASLRTPLKRFSHAQIAEKVRERANVVEYEQLLMSAAVQQDDTGVVFDSTAAGWKELVRRCEQADKVERESEKRRKVAAASSSAHPPPTHSTAAAVGASEQSVSVVRSPSPAPSTAASLLSKLTAAMAPKHNGSAVGSGSGSGGRAHDSEDEREAQDGTTGNGRALSATVRGKPVAAPRPTADRGRRGSQPTVAPTMQQATAQPVTAADSSDAQQQQQQQHSRRMKRATVASTPTSAASNTDEAASAAGDASQLSAPSPSDSDSRRIRPVRMLHSAAQRTNADRIKRSANKQVRDAQQLQADLAFEQRLADETDGKCDDNTVSAEWRDRRARENEREAERRRREEEEERQRIAAGGRKKRKLVIPPAAQIRHSSSGEAIDELDYMQTLLLQLSEPDDERVDWQLTAQLASVTGLPHKHRLRVWSVMLQRSAAAASEPHDAVDAEDEELEAVINRLTLSPDEAVSPSSCPGLDSPPLPLPSSSLPSPKLDLINQRTVRVDIDRTLPHFARMQRPDVKHDMEVILTA